EGLVNYTIEELMNLKISSVSKQEEKLSDAPQFVTVITAEELRQRGYIDLEKVIHDLAGFDVSRGNGTHYSQIYQRGYRSKNTDRTLLLIDGVEENDLWSGNIWLSRQYSLSNIERIEIIYGPASTLYGANAFIGVINIVTKEQTANLAESNIIHVNGIANYGSWNTKFVDATLSANAKKIQLMLTGRLYKSDEMDLSEYDDWDYDLTDYDANFYNDILGTSDLGIVNSAMHLDSLGYLNDSVLNGKTPHFSNTTEDWLLYGKLKIDNFTIGLQMWERNEGYGSWYRDDFELGPDHGGKWVAQNSFFTIKYDKKFSDKFSLSNHTRYKIHQLKGTCEEYYYVGYLNRELVLNDLIDTLGNPLANPATPYWLHTYWNVFSQQIRSELKAIYKPIERLNLTSGIEFRRSLIQGAYLTSNVENPSETAESPGTDGGNHFQGYDIGVFTQLNYRFIEYFSVVTGGRLDYNKVRETGGYGMVFNPKIALIYARNNFNLKLIYSEAFKDAENWVKYGTTPGRLLTNPSLKPERVNNIEISTGYNVNGNIYSTITAFQSNYSDVVGTVDVSYINEEGKPVQTTQHQAIGSLMIQGLQANVKAKYGNYSSYFNYTFINPQNTEADTLVRIGDIASHRFNLGFNALIFDKLNANVRMNYVGKRKTGSNTTVKSNPVDIVDAYYLVHATITYEYVNGVYLQLSVNNLFDAEYFHPGVRSANGAYYAAVMPQNERNFMLKLLFDL
ncbi:TonB-dependent receptor plug domain-containing protein, partial [Bacteroidota bacterium]